MVCEFKSVHKTYQVDTAEEPGQMHDRVSLYSFKGETWKEKVAA